MHVRRGASRKAGPPPRRRGRAARGRGGRKLPDLGEVLKANFDGLPGTARDWHRSIGAKWLGPYTPQYVSPGVLKIMRDDPQLSLGLEAIKSQFHGIEWWAKGGRPEVRALVERTFLQAPLWDKFLASVTNCLDFGYQSHEVVWERKTIELEPEGGTSKVVFPRAYMIEALKSIDPERVEVHADDHGRLEGLIVGDQELPLDKVFHAVRAFEWDDLLGRSLLKIAYNPFYWDNFLALYMMRHAESRITPPTKAEGPIDARSTDEKTRTGQSPRNPLRLLAEQAAALRNGSVAALPWEDNGHGQNKYKLEFMAGTPGAIAEFVLARNHMAALKLRALAIPDRAITQDTATGSFAMADAHVQLWLSILEKFKHDTIMDGANQVARLIVLANYDASEPVPTIEGAPLVRQGRDAMLQLMLAALDVPIVREDGTSYSPKQLLNFEAGFRALNTPYRKPSEIVAASAPAVKTIGPADPSAA